MGDVAVAAGAVMQRSTTAVLELLQQPVESGGSARPCRRSEHPQVAVAGAPSLTCSASQSQVDAAAVRAVVRAQRGCGLQSLQTPAVRVVARQRSDSSRALSIQFWKLSRQPFAQSLSRYGVTAARSTWRRWSAAGTMAPGLTWTRTDPAHRATARDHLFGGLDLDILLAKPDHVVADARGLLGMA